ncbi:MAG: hypothetical protein WAV38_06815 [Xanthobacteraceae bacterium]
MNTTFEPANVQMALGEIHLIPAQIDGLGDTQAMASHEKDQRGVPPTITALPTRLDELVKFVFR